MASPYGLDLPGDFDEDQSSIDRRKLQLIAAMKTPIGGAGSGLLGGIGNFLQNAVGTNLLSGQDARARELAGQRDAYARQALEDYGKLDKPAVPEQVGTGPIAPPPGTPGVEAMLPQSSEPAAGETGPPAPIPQEAGWMGRGGMVPQGVEFAPNKAGQPMIPGAMSDKLTTLARVAQGGPMYAKVADKVLTQELEAPLKREQAQILADAKREENLRRYEDKLADNKREERRLDETIRSNKTSEEERARANRTQEALRGDSLRLQAQIAAERSDARATAAADKAEAAKGKLSADQKEITNHTKLIGEAYRHDKLPQLDEKLAAVEKVIGEYAEKKKPIPGVGVIESQLSPALIGEEAIKVRTPITQLRNLITVSEAGLSQTAAEMRNVLQGMGLGPLSPESAFLEAIPRLRETLETRKRTINATYRPEAVEEFHRRLGTAPAGKTVVKQVTIDGVTHHKYSDGSED